MSEFVMPPAYSMRAGRCEHLRANGADCGKPSRWAFRATAPAYPAGNGETRNHVACSTVHARELAISLWGIGYDFPEARR
jgi:hypothetical protein